MKKSVSRAMSTADQAIRSFHRISLITAVAVLAACSGAVEPTTASEALAVQSSPLSQADASTVAAPAAPSMIGSIKLPAWTQCAVSESGNANPSHSDIVFAGFDGKVHFTPPPSDWGTKLNFNCSLNGNPQGTYIVDFNDTSTFTEESQPALAAQPVGARPALTGDLTSLSNSQLLEQGYPPRPDPQADPQQYSRWVDAVSSPVSVFQPVPITHIGVHAYGQYKGSTTCNWTGFVQSADGFPSSLGCGITTNWAGATYTEYVFTSYVPWVSGCLSNDCGTGIWAGIGGTVVATYGTSNLIQSGFFMDALGNSSLFVEFTPASLVVPTLPTGDNFAHGDEFQIWGWTASQSNCAYTTSFNNTSFGCFGFQDITKGWSYSATPMAQSRGGSGNVFIPTSGELIAEEPSGFTNSNYSNTNVSGGFYDENETYHADPGASSATDPYIYVQQNDGSGNPLNLAQWTNGTQNTPRDPVTFIQQNSN
jgi:hypothetical protein